MRVLLAALSLLAPPAHLVDGSRPPAVPRALAGFGAVAMTRARVVPVQALPDAWRSPVSS